MIKEFQGKYRWLSNFAPVSITLCTITYPSVEHAYMSCKSHEAAWKVFCADSLNRPGAVKKASRKVSLRPDWEEVKVRVMLECLRQKFNTPMYKDLLLHTGSLLIQEGNRWHDTFWGVDLTTGKGLNTLGKLIMQIREEFKEDD